MRVGWGTWQILALVLLAVVLFAVSGFLELMNVARLAVDRAATESDLISKALHFQINHVVRERAGEPTRALREDPRIGLVLTAGIAQAPSIVFVAVCDSSSTVVAHTVPERVGTPFVSLPPLPRSLTATQTASLVLTLLRTPQVYELSTPLLLGEVPFATIHVGIAGVFVRERILQVFRRNAVVGAVEIPFALILGFGLARLATRRLRQLGEGVAALRAGQFDSPIPESGIEEFSRLARDLNLLSEQFQRERAERDSRFQQTVELLGDGILTLGPDGEVVLMNAATGRILGLPPAESRGKRLDEVLAADHPVRQLADRVLHGEGRSLSVTLQQIPGSAAHVAVAHRISGSEGPGGVLIEFKETAALDGVHSLVDHSQVLSRLGQMAAGVAHEIRSSLQSISFELSAVREARAFDKEALEAHVRTASSEIERLRRTVDGYLRVARLRSIQAEPLQVNDLLEEIVQNMAAEAVLSGVELELDLCSGMPETHADREVMRQAVLNLVKNAIQAYPSRDRRVRLASRTDGGEITISVSDTGPGIPDGIRDKVCNLYFTTKEGGTGVGLALVRQAIEMHGGGLQIESREGEGTRMTLRLPIRSPLPLYG